MCRAPTQFWYGTGESNVALCKSCADKYTTAELPTKKEWCDKELALMKQYD